MPGTDTLIVVALAGLALSVTPGPSMLYVLSRTLGQGWRAGIASSIGLALGGVLLAVAAAIGLSTVLRHSDFVFYAIKVAGALYLIYLGIDGIVSALRAAPAADEPVGEVRRESTLRLVAQGILVEVLNPKTILFFLAFVPQFVDPGNGNTVVQMLILGALVPLTAIPSDVVVSLGGNFVVHRIRRSRAAQIALEILAGAFLIGIGLHLFLAN